MHVHTFCIDNIPKNLDPALGARNGGQCFEAVCESVEVEVWSDPLAAVVETLEFGQNEEIALFCAQLEVLRVAMIEHS